MTDKNNGTDISLFSGFKIYCVESGTKIAHPTDPEKFEVVDEDHAVQRGRAFYLTKGACEALKNRCVGV